MIRAGHIARILTTIALYEVLQQHGKSEPEAFDIISRTMWGALTPKTCQKLARLSFFMPMMKKILHAHDEEDPAFRLPSQAGVTPGIWAKIRKIAFISSAGNACTGTFLRNIT